MTHLELRRPRPDARCAATNMFESVSLLYREFGMTVTHGVGLWYMDLFRGTFRDPELVEAVGRMRRAADLALVHDRAHRSEVAVVSNIQSEFYMGYRSTEANNISQLFYHQQIGGFYRAGAPFDWYLAEDLKSVPVAVRKENDGWTGVFSALPALAPDVLRRLYASAGVHVYTDEDVVLSANSAWIMLHTRKRGDYHVRLPRRVKEVRDVTIEKVVARDCDAFTYPMEKFQTAVFLLEDF